MDQILLKQKKLQGLLTSLTDEFLNDTIIELCNQKKYIKKDDLIPEEIHPCSAEYFNRARTKEIRNYSFPRASRGISDGMLSPNDYTKYDTIRSSMQKMVKYLGVTCNALSMIYPDNGYIGWHHNGNAPGYNILLTYSIDGDGNFKYYDYQTKDFVILQDNPGWNVRVGYYPDQNKFPEKVFWHCAETKKKRITVAFVINHKGMWTDLIEEISGGDYDKEIISRHNF